MVDGTVPVSAGDRTVLTSLLLMLVVALLRCGNSQHQAPAHSIEGKHYMGVNPEVQSITKLLLVFIEGK